MKKCIVCGKSMILGYRDGNDRFCSLRCLTYSPKLAFCSKCIDGTIPESPGNTTSVNLIAGTRLVDAKNRCPICHSIVQRKLLLAVVFFGTIDRFRVIYVNNTEYIGRRLRKSEDPPDHVIIQAKHDNLTADKLFGEARLLERRKQFEKSLAVYEGILSRFPQTEAAREAGYYINRLRSKIERTR